MHKKSAVLTALLLIIEIAIAIFAPEQCVNLPEIILVVNLVIGGIWTYRVFGTKNAFILIGLSFVITIILENVSIATGFPYGVFKHSLPGPWIGEVPVAVGFVYFPFVTLGWVYGDLIVTHIRASDSTKRIVRILLAMLVVGSVEALYDPVGCLVLHRWEYTNGGGVFGVPLTNALGWMLNTGLTIVLYEAIIGKKSNADIKAERHHAHILWLLAIQPIPQLIGRFALENQTLYDSTGKAWGLVDLFDTLGIFGLMMMGMLVLFGSIAYLWIGQSELTE